MNKIKSNFRDRQVHMYDEYARNVKKINLHTVYGSDEHMFFYILSFMKEIKKKKVLDFGCGTGRFGLQLARYAKEVIGVDISEKSIAVANKTAQKYTIKNFIGICGDIDKADYKHYFDYIVAINVIHHVDNLEELFSQLKTFLKKEGVIFLLEFNPLNPFFLPFLFFIGQFKEHLTKEYIRSNIFTLTRILSRNKFLYNVHKYGMIPPTLQYYSNIFLYTDRILKKIPILNLFPMYHLVECMA